MGMAILASLVGILREKNIFLFDVLTTLISVFKDSRYVCKILFLVSEFQIFMKWFFQYFPELNKMACHANQRKDDSGVTVLKFSANMSFLFPDDPISKYQMAKHAGIIILKSIFINHGTVPQTLLNWDKWNIFLLPCFNSFWDKEISKTYFKVPITVIESQLHMKKCVCFRIYGSWMGKWHLWASSSWTRRTKQRQKDEACFDKYVHRYFTQCMVSQIFCSYFFSTPIHNICILKIVPNSLWKSGADLIVCQNKTKKSILFY